MSSTNNPTNPLKDVLSDDAAKALMTIVQRDLKKAKSTEGISLSQAQKDARQATHIVVADLDGADGAFDGKIDKALLNEKLGKSSLLLGMVGGDKAKLAKEIEKMGSKIAEGDTLDTKKLLTEWGAKSDENIKELFQRLDTNKDGVLSITDRDAVEATPVATPARKPIPRAGRA